MDSSKFLKKSAKAKGGDGFKWTGTIQDLDKFFSALGYTGTWSSPPSGGSLKFTNEQFTCTWYENTKSLLIQGKKSSELKGELNEALDNLIPLTAAKDESDTRDVEAKSVNRQQKEFNEGEIRDGLNPGKAIKNLLEFRLKKWDSEGAKVTIATPFMDKAGLIFIQSCLQNETALDKIYTREVCGWDKKIDLVIAEAELSKKCIVNKVVALKTSPSFHAKFLVGEYKDKVELIVTSSNMTKEHLFSDQLETVMRLQPPVDTFHSDWLKPLEDMVEEGNTVKFLNLDDVSQEAQNIE